MWKTGLLLCCCASFIGTAAPIDRKALVERHNPILNALDVDAPVTVGNGEFAFSADITGLQTFPELYHRNGVPVETQARWCWVESPNTNGYSLAQASKLFRNANGEMAPYPTQASTPAGDWLRKTPRIQPLGQLSLHFEGSKEGRLEQGQITGPRQSLNMWEGVILSRFMLEGKPVEVTTVAHPQIDQISVRIRSPWLREGRMGVRLAFPQGYDSDIKLTPPLDWSQPDSHTTTMTLERRNGARFDRAVDYTRYTSLLRWDTPAEVKQTGLHEFLLKSTGRDTLEFSLGFFPQGVANRSVDFAGTLRASRQHWPQFWKGGAALDFTGSTDPRAEILERRVVLSQYLMAVQMAGSVPPQESGLTCSTWYGKHHTEMIWWHAAHFALWRRDALLERNLDWYRSQLPAARELAKERKLKGARWAKMTGPQMRESPGGNPLIVWNQPHMVHLAEMLYRNQPNVQTLNKYKDLVLETAECMSSMLYFDEKRGSYVLGPPLWIAQEIYDQATSQNPSYELAYWRWGLETAQKWRERLGMQRNADWDDRIRRLSPLPVKDGKYVALESNPDTFDNIDSRHDHPTILAPLGMLPGPGVNRETMGRTLDAVLATWDWETKIWGWDYPMIAMTAARLGRPEEAVEILLRNGPNNLYLPTGHCPQRSDEAALKSNKPGARKREIAVYLPANGALLSAVAMMAAGWDGNTNAAPGFPANGQWKVKAEGFSRLP